METAGVVQFFWSIGNRTDLPVGSRLFLMRLGEHPKGLIASGWSASPPIRRPHWDAERAAAGDMLPMVRAEFDVLGGLPLVSLDELSQPLFADFAWTPQSSGVEIPENIARALESLWAERSGTPLPSASNATPTTFIEGGRREVVVNAYERSPSARRACVEHFQQRARTIARRCRVRQGRWSSEAGTLPEPANRRQTDGDDGVPGRARSAMG
jgi:5-methylcytosine-specific restriction enzyme A